MRNPSRLIPGMITGLLLGLSILTGAAAQEVQRIAAVVNDEPISTYDVNLRLGLIISTTGQVESEEAFAEMREFVVQSLIDEKLQIQEAAEFEVFITDQEVEQEFAGFAAANNISAEQFEQTLVQMGTSKEALARQIRASIAWRELVNGRLRPQVAVGDTEMEEFIARMEENKGKPEYLLAEIFLAVDNPQDEGDVIRNANRLVQQIQEGANFANVARQFSDTASAAAGGDMGWMAYNHLDPELEKVVRNMRRGSISEPVRATGGYYILLLRDKRLIMSADPAETQVTLQQIVIQAGRNPESRIEQARNATRAITSCSQVESVAKELGTEDFGDLGKLKLGDLPELFRAVIEGLEPGQASEPVQAGSVIRVFVVCDRDAPKVEIPSDEQIEDMLVNQRLNMMARRYLRDLRNDAIIDVRGGE